MPVIGIDVGGTNTDAALLQGREVVALAKRPTRRGELFSSIQDVLEEVLSSYRGSDQIELHLSTTLSTNAIIEGTGLPTEVAAVPGPGVNLSSLGYDFPIHELNGYIDHRGRETAPLDFEQIRQVKAVLKKNECRALAVVGKFSQRNPKHEKEIERRLRTDPEMEISLGHALSGRANFPRRLVTAYLNASVARRQKDFARIWKDSSSKLGRFKKILFLKADGGTMTLQDSQNRPVETILSGPAASIMGAQALSSLEMKNLVMIDIGGTTTDIAVVVGGKPLFERAGAVISGYKTLVPALLTRSLGLGGDSAVKYLKEQRRFQLGPKRAGAAVCLGGEQLTPTDAAVALGLAQLGKKDAALKACRELGLKLDLQWREVAQGIMDAFSRQLTEAIRGLYAELENIPLYTVSEILDPPSIKPEALLGLGAPAEVFAPLAAQKLNLAFEIAACSAGANAVGAAAARATAGLTLYADTELGTVTVPEIGYCRELKRPLFFNLERARQSAKRKTREYARNLGLEQTDDIYIPEEESFNLVRGFRTVGQIHMVRTQLRPQVRKIGGAAGEKN